MHPQNVVGHVRPVGRAQHAVVGGSLRAPLAVDLERHVVGGHSVLHREQRDDARAESCAHLAIRAVGVGGALDIGCHAHALAFPCPNGLAVGVGPARQAVAIRAEEALAGVRAGAVGVPLAEGERDIAAARAPAAVGEDVLPRPDVVHVGVEVVRVVVRAVLRHVRDGAHAIQVRLVRVRVGRAQHRVVRPRQAVGAGRAGPVAPIARQSFGRHRVVRGRIFGHLRAVPHRVDPQRLHAEVGRAAEAARAEVGVDERAVAQQVLLVREHRHALRVDAGQPECLVERAVGSVLRLARHRDVVADRKVPVVGPPVGDHVAVLPLKKLKKNA